MVYQLPAQTYFYQKDIIGSINVGQKMEWYTLRHKKWFFPLGLF